MMQTNKILSLSVLFFFVFAPSASCKHEEPLVCKEFYDLPAAQREKDFPAYSVGKQLDIYRCAMQKKPPESGWAHDIAKGGDKIVPVLLERLNAEKNEHMQNHLIYVFEIMSENGYLKGKQEVVDQIRVRVSQISNSLIKADAEESLNRIEKNINMK